MTPTQAVPASPIIHNYSIDQRPPVPHRPFSDPNHLAPEDAFYPHLPPRRQQPVEQYSELDGDAVTTSIPSVRGGATTRRKRGRDRPRSGNRRGKKVWKKLLWVKQKDCMFERCFNRAFLILYADPDNYTDPPTFLSRLQRNPRLRPYDFWPLVADSTVIVQHISSVAIFVCSFVGIYQQRVSPVSVVSWGSASTVLGWILWDFWVGQAAALKPLPDSSAALERNHGVFINGSTLGSPITTDSPTPSTHSNYSQTIGLGLSLATANLTQRKQHGHSRSQTSTSSGPSPTLSHHPSHSTLHASHPATILYNTPRTHQRLATVKSAILIYIALLGLSPILKSLTRSTTSDSIWAMSYILMCINILFFDYSGGVGGVKFPASLSTNAALMASTVLASRLRSTTHVFSLTLFSIEVFGLFPVFRRHLRHMSWRGHIILTLALMIGAGAGLGLIISDKPFVRGGWKRAIAGAVIWALGSTVGMGGCSWWLIGLQRYKNVVIGPWDPARPIIRAGGWD